MRIGVVGSMQYTERMMEACAELTRRGHEAFMSSFAQAFVGKNDEEKEEIKIRQKNDLDAIRDFWRQMQGADAILVMNLDKHGVKNYIGGNTFLEMGFAHVLNQKIFLLNPIPDMPYYKTEITAMKPVIIDCDLNRIK